MRPDVREVIIPVDERALGGTLALPQAPAGLVMFAHGSGSSRHSPRNRHVAATLNVHGLGTLLFDLLTADEERIDAIDASLRFDVEMLAARLGAATDSVRAQAPLRGLPIGYFGGSTGAAAALIAAAQRPAAIAAIVARGGRCDLAAGALPRVRAPTLMIVGGEDTWVLGANREAAAQMTCVRQLEVVPGATHLFEEPGALDEVARLAATWFVHHFAAARLAHAS